MLKQLIVNDPVIVSQESILGSIKTAGDLWTLGKPSVKPQTATLNPIERDNKKSKKNEIFVDVFEKISVLFNSSGYVINSAIEGCIQMKSYLIGNPPLKLALNEGLVVGQHNAASGTVVLDDCNFHESVSTSEFDLNKTLRIHPPDGEFVVMNYRITSEF